MALQPSSLGTIAMETVGAQSSNDLSFSVKTQTKSVLEICHALPPGVSGENKAKPSAAEERIS
jgi:hypothetical protein